MINRAPVEVCPMRLLLLMVVFMLLGGQGQAEWIHAYDSSGGKKYYCNDDGIEAYDDYNRVWVKVVSPHGKVVKYQWDFHIDERKMRPYYFESIDPEEGVTSAYLSVAT